MSVEEKETCNMHTKEKENSGTCCQIKDEEEVKRRRQRRLEMNKLFLVLALLFALSACSVGKKCTYTQDGTKLYILCMVL